VIFIKWVKFQKNILIIKLFYFFTFFRGTKNRIGIGIVNFDEMLFPLPLFTLFHSGEISKIIVSKPILLPPKLLFMTEVIDKFLKDKVQL
jgi:hypothetical protein